MNQRELAKLARQAIAPPDTEENQCVRCHCTMHKDPELDHSALCNLCAQEAAWQLAHAYLNQRKVPKRG